MSLISLVYPTKHIIYKNLGEIGEIPCAALFGGYVERLLKFPLPSTIGKVRIGINCCLTAAILTVLFRNFCCVVSHQAYLFCVCKFLSLSCCHGS